jgi:hypothetical protein
LDTYTFEHLNHFLLEIARDRRYQFKQMITAVRVGNADQKGYKDYMNHLRQQERAALAERKRGTVRNNFQTYEEQTWMAAREHVRFSEMAPEQQAKLTAEMDGLFGQIPPHVIAKSKRMAGLA